MGVVKDGLDFADREWLIREYEYYRQHPERDPDRSPLGSADVLPPGVFGGPVRLSDDDRKVCDGPWGHDWQNAIYGDL